MIKIKINTNDAAISEDPTEIARILRDLADKFEAQSLTHLHNLELFDVNGVHVGIVKTRQR